MNRTIISGLLISIAFLFAGSADATSYVTQYIYNSIGNLTSIVSPNGTSTYGYDARSRINSEAGPAGGQSSSYDGNGNRVSDSGGSYTYPASPTPSNRLASRYGAPYTYDGSTGNIANDGTYQYVYTKGP